MPSTLQSIPGSAGLRRSFPSSVLIVGPRKRLKASPPQAQSQAAVVGCVLGSFLLMTKISFPSPTVGVASDATNVLSALKLATKNKAVRIEGCTVHLFLLPS